MRAVLRRQEFCVGGESGGVCAGRALPLLGRCCVRAGLAVQDPRAGWAAAGSAAPGVAAPQQRGADSPACWELQPRGAGGESSLPRLGEKDDIGV